MRGKALFVAALTAALVVAIGCHHDKHNVTYQPKEECVLPADEARFNNPPSAAYRKPPPKKEEKALLGREQMGSGFGPGGF